MNLAELQFRLRHTVEFLAGGIGERNVYHRDRLDTCAHWIESELAGAGWRPERQMFEFDGSPHECPGSHRVWNIVAERKGISKPDEIIVAGAHYDTKVHTRSWRGRDGIDPSQPGTPGADDNTSGVAAVLELARAFATATPQRTVRFVFFVNEEPPFFLTEAMGSWQYARECRRRGERVVGMFTPETLGIYSVRPRTKRVAAASWIGLPDRPDYVAFLSNRASRPWVREAARHFEAGSIGLRTVAFPALHRRVAWSDDWSFWQFGYPAFAVTDTAYLRHDYYHEITDTPDQLDYPEFGLVTRGLIGMLRALAGG